MPFTNGIFNIILGHETYFFLNGFFELPSNIDRTRRLVKNFFLFGRIPFPLAHVFYYSNLYHIFFSIGSGRLVE